MRSMVANLRHPVKGVQISYLGEKKFLFKFFHKMDLERVLKGSPWTFNNHLLMMHCLELGEDLKRFRERDAKLFTYKGSDVRHPLN
ncbi:hypothetical protein Golob_002555, partial [Gossypium lobatum]|nr:hypothetical protein [Gossypium lobatum]